MTIVAYRGDTLYADSMSCKTITDTISYYEANKLHVSPCKRIALTKASLILTEKDIAYVFDSLISRFTMDDQLKFRAYAIDNKTLQLYLGSSIIMTKAATWFYNENDTNLIRVGSDDTAASGTGAEIFQMAIALGKTGIEAIKDTIQYGNLCGGKICMVKRTSLKPFKVIQSKEIK